MKAKPLEHWFDDQGRLVRWPRKRGMQIQALHRLAERFPAGRNYTEREVTDLIRSMHLFDDHALVRREMVDLGLLHRLRDGSRYWRPDPSA